MDRADEGIIPGRCPLHLEDGSYVRGWWMPAGSAPRSGYAWVSAWLDDDARVDGYRVTDEVYASADPERWEPDAGWDAPRKEAPIPVLEPAPEPAPFGRLAAIKTVHTVVWAFFVGAIVALPISAGAGRYDLALVFIGIVLVEVLVLLAGLTASWLLDYAQFWTTPEMAGMRPLDSPWVAAGPALQVVRGLVLAVVLYPFRTVFLEKRRGWLALWGLLAGVGIVSTYGPSPGSLEGFVYTRTPLLSHLRGLPEVLVQSLAFSGCLVGWYRWPTRAWPLTLGTLTAIAILVSLAGVFLAPLAR